MSEILVGFDDTARADDALAFATRVARTTGASLRLVAVYPYDDLGTEAADAGLRDYLQEDADAALAAAAASVDGVDIAATEAIADVSPSRALHAAAERCGAALVVVGSTHRGRIGRVLPGSTGERLLHGSSSAVAIVPRGHAKDPGQIATVGAGYDGSDEAAVALEAACRIARLFAAALCVFGVFDASCVGQPALMTGPAWSTMRDEHDAAQREQLEQAVAALPDAIDAQPRFLDGRRGEELARQSGAVDVMVVGSRGRGPLSAVLHGGATHTLLAHAACPVIVVPRNALGRITALFAPTMSGTA
jgi:nucleotide-binding universal stress UspA family protein